MHMTARLKNKVAIVTGAASGIGSATIEKFLDEGATVLATDINEAGLDQLLEAEEPRLTTFPGNITKYAEVEAIISECVSEFGQVNILVNSAGITPRTLPPEADFEERWEAVMALVVTAGLAVVSYWLFFSWAQGGGSQREPLTTPGPQERYADS